MVNTVAEGQTARIIEQGAFRYQLCEKCGGHLQGGSIPDHIEPCRCETLTRAARQAIDDADLSGRMTFDSLEEPHESVVGCAKTLAAIVRGERQGKCKGVAMFGEPGLGKTHLSVAFARSMLARGKRVGYYTVTGLVGRVQQTYGYDDSAESRASIMRELTLCDAVILDDLGKERASADVDSIVYEVFDALYRAKVTTIVSSNLVSEDFMARYETAVLSRLSGLCEKTVIRGEDRRGFSW